MGLKSRINGAYAEWDKKVSSFKSEIGLCENNLDQVQANIRKLKESLCRFAVKFDKSPSISVATLNCRQRNPMYEDIASNFVGRILDAANNFIYIYAKGEKSKNAFEEKWGRAIEKFSFPYQNILDKFNDYKKLIDFFNDASEFFGKSMQEGNFCWWKDVHGINPTDDIDIIKINSALNLFVGNIFGIMADELEHKDELIVVNDEKHFNDLDALVGRGLHSPVFAEVIKKAEKSLKSNPDFQGDLDDECLKNYIVQNFAKLFPKGIKLPEDMLSLLEKHTIQPVIGNVKIFPSKESPLPKEVKQAGVGDCYLMGSLIALAKSKKNAQDIKDCFVQGIDKIEQLDNIKIRFFYIKPDGSVGKIIILVNKKKVIMPESIKDGALWPKLIEKAYAIYRKKGYEKDVIKNRKYLDSGKSKNVLFAITGIPPGEYTVGTDAKDKFNSENIIKTIERKLGKQKAISCRFKENFTINDLKNGEKIEVHTRHAYAIVGVEQSKKYIRLIEPNKFWGRMNARVIGKDEKTGKDIIKLPKEGGHIAMSFDDFNAHLDKLYYTRNPKI